MMINQNLKIPSTLEMLKSIRTIRSEWKWKSPLEKYCYMIGIGKPASVVVGIPLFQEDHTVSWRSYATYGYVGLFACDAAYTIINRIIGGQIARSLTCTCLLSVLIPCVPFIHAVIAKKEEKPHHLITFAGRYIYRDERDKTKYNKICSDHMDITARNFVLKVMLISVGGVSAVSGPIIAYFTDGIKTSTTDLLFPFIEEESDAHFITNLIFQFSIYFHAFFLYLVMEIAMVLIENVASLVPKLVKHESGKLIEESEQQELSELQLILTVKNIVKMAVDHDNYMRSVKSFLYVRTLLIPMLYAYSIGMSIFCQFTVNYIAGYGMAIMSYVQLYFTVEVGETIENNGLDEALYCGQWYSLPPKAQMMILTVMRRQKHGVKLTEGPFRTINRQLFGTITNQTYTLITFLLNFGK